MSAKLFSGRIGSDFDVSTNVTATYGQALGQSLSSTDTYIKPTESSSAATNELPFLKKNEDSTKQNLECLEVHLHPSQCHRSNGAKKRFKSSTDLKEPCDSSQNHKDIVETDNAEVSLTLSKEESYDLESSDQELSLPLNPRDAVLLGSILTNLQAWKECDVSEPGDLQFIKFVELTSLIAQDLSKLSDLSTNNYSKGVESNCSILRQSNSSAAINHLSSNNLLVRITQKYDWRPRLKLIFMDPDIDEFLDEIMQAGSRNNWDMNATRLPGPAFTPREELRDQLTQLLWSSSNFSSSSSSADVTLNTNAAPPTEPLWQDAFSVLPVQDCLTQFRNNQSTMAEQLTQIIREREGWDTNNVNPVWTIREVLGLLEETKNHFQSTRIRRVPAGNYQVQPYALTQGQCQKESDSVSKNGNFLARTKPPSESKPSQKRKAENEKPEADSDEDDEDTQETALLGGGLNDKKSDEGLSRPLIPVQVTMNRNRKASTSGRLKLNYHGQIQEIVVDHNDVDELPFFDVESDAEFGGDNGKDEIDDGFQSLPSSPLGPRQQTPLDQHSSQSTMPAAAASPSRRLIILKNAKKKFRDFF